MTPRAFIRMWQAADLKPRSVARELQALLWNSCPDRGRHGR
jgi:hypothetical protein